MDIITRKANPGRSEKKGDCGNRRGIDRLGTRLGDPADRSPPEEVKKKKL